MRTSLFVFPLAALAACAPTLAPAPAPTPAPAPPPTAAAAAEAMPLALHWTRTAAEHRAVFLQTYRWAGERLRALAAGAPAGRWAVILDADETVIDNSEYQRRRAALGLGYTEESWQAWAREEEATALPGAAEFVRLVRQLGGRVAIVTNRYEAICDDTRDNLRKLGIVFDVVLCRPEDGPSDKNPRFQAVQSGTGTGLPPLRVLMWVGDNIQDFPALTQAVRERGDEAFAEFGRTYVVLPNPMYGSWERNPPR